MVDKKVSDFPPMSTLTGSELLTGLQGGVNENATIAEIAAYAISPMLPEGTLLGRGVGAGDGVNESIYPGDQLVFSGQGLNTVEPLNVLNAMPAKLDYQLGNSSAFASTTSTTEVVLKSFTIPADTFTAIDDNIWGDFSGNFVVASGQTGTVRIYINSVLIASNIISTFPSGSWDANFKVILNNAISGARCEAEIGSCSASTNTAKNTGVVNITLNPLLSFTVELRALVSVAPNSVSCSLGTVSGAKNI